ncbi:sulfotransferase family 2 domain-containing protein [Bacillus gobiensis]|uniref:sulfotransferase family 2 domain-containing protein n=1 Tax=Bacillus gobiensis TaxID=1441095 RepID=UPI003D1B2DA6
MGKKETLEQYETYRGPLCHKDFPLILFWSEKAGCTNLTKWFFFQTGLMDEALKQQSIHVYRSEIFQKKKNYYSYINKQLLHSKKDAVKLIRNPFKRAVSSFLTISYYCFTTHPPNGMYADWERISQLYYQGQSPYKGITFKQFLHYLEKTGTELNNVDRHIAQQYIEGEEELISRYIKLENIIKDIEDLENKYGLPHSPHSVYAQKNDHDFKDSMINQGVFADEIITFDMILNKSLPKFEGFYDQEAVDLCKEIFKKDFEIYEKY